VQAAAAAVQGIEELIRGEVGVRSLQDLHADLASWRGSGEMGSVRDRGGQ
jgi:carbamoyl-phosphate synthase large subunit